MSDWAIRDTPAPTTFVQWKGTDVCMDVYCLCGEEPWATLMMLQEKCVETRSWRFPDFILGQHVVIHSAKGFPKWAKDLCLEEPFRTSLRPHGNYAYPELNRGKGLCVVKFISCRKTEDVRLKLSAKELAFGDYADGRYAWTTEYVERWAMPTPAVGHLGFWNWGA